MMKTVMAHQQAPIPSLRQQRGDVPPSLEKVFRRMLGKGRQERYPSMTELIAALEACDIRDDTPPLLLDKPIRDATVAETISPATTSKMTEHGALGRSVASRRLKRRTVLLLGAFFAGAAVLLGFLLKLDTPWGRLRLEYKETTGRDDERPGAQRSQRSPAGNVDSAPHAAIPPGDYALSFDGEGDYVVIPSLKYDGSHPLTIQCLCRLDEPTGESMMIVTDAHSGRGVSLLVNREGEVTFGPRGHRVLTSQAPLEPGVPVRVAAVLSDEEMRLYVDGSLQDVKPIDPGFRYAASDLPLTIGASQDGGGGFQNFWRGQIDELRISRVARRHQDIVSAARYEADAATLAVYHFDEAQGGDVVDSSGNERHGDIAGAKWVLSPVIDAERSVAEWVLRKMGQVNVLAPGGAFRPCKSLADLPDESFVIRQIMLNTFHGHEEVRDADVKRFSRLTSLVLLTLDGQDLSEVIVETLEELPPLLQLSLYGSRIDDKALARLVAAHPDLVLLNIGDTQVTAEGIPEILKLGKLETVFLQHLPLSNDAILKLEPLKSLRTLCINGTQITDEGLTALADWPNLQRIELAHTSVTAEGVRQFRAARPDCEVVRNDVE